MIKNKIIDHYHFMNLRQIFGKYFRTIGKDSSDVWLIAEGVYIAAHQFVLGACSPCFEEMFIKLNENAEEPKRKLAIVLEGYRSSDVQKMCDFIYKGELMIDESDTNFETLMKLAVKYEVTGLVESIQEKRKEQIKLKVKNTEHVINTQMIKSSPESSEEVSFENGNALTGSPKGSMESIQDSGTLLCEIKTETTSDMYELESIDEAINNTKVNRTKWSQSQIKKALDINLKQNKSFKNVNPRKLLNDIVSNSVKFEDTYLVIGGVSQRLCTANIDGEQYLGTGNTVDEARQQAAIQVLTQHFDIPFSMD